MRMALLFLAACSSSAAPARPPTPPAPTPPVTTPTQPATPAPIARETLAADTPKTTVAGNPFVAPAGWTYWVDGPAVVLEAPEQDSRIAFVDVKASDAAAAVELAWAAYKPTKRWPLDRAVELPDRDGWTRGKQFAYRTPPNEKRGMAAIALFANDGWTVVLVDVAEATAEKRGSQLGTMFARFVPRGGQRESFAGKMANALDAARIAMLTKFVEDSQKVLGHEGIALGIVENGKTLFAGGWGPRAFGKPAKIDANTRFMIGSNTKALTTLMLAKLVDEKKLTWETPAKALLPTFALGDPDTTDKVLVKHLICACTGMPRQDLEWILEYRGLTPAAVMTKLATMKPTSKFGELFQYSNVMAAAAGYVGGYVAFPKLELGAAYDRAMQTYVFGPLGMKATTLDYRKAQQGNFALPIATDLAGKAAPGQHQMNDSIIPVRPAGAAWSTVHDMLAYVNMELAEGKAGGKQYISKDSLLARRAPQVGIGKDITYGMGLMVDTTYGVAVIDHGGDTFGYHSNMMWLPEYGIGAVILSNDERTAVIRSQFKRRLLEVLFDGKPLAEAEIAAAQKRHVQALELRKQQLVVPADATEAGKLAARYQEPSLGELKILRQGGKTVFDFGEWKSEVATRKEADGSITYVTIAPGIFGLELAVGEAGGKRTLILRDAQHEYAFTER